MLLPKQIYCLIIHIVGIQFTEGAIVKILFHIAAAISLLLFGFSLAFGSGLFAAGRTPTVDRWPYSFGDRYHYDNTGSRWNYDSSNPSRHSKPHTKYWQPRFEYDFKIESHTNKQFQDLIEHLTDDNIHHNKRFPYNPTCR
jgi:hypothetical protein